MVRQEGLLRSDVHHLHHLHHANMHPSFTGSDETNVEPEAQWFVYLFALYDCSAFKIGFSCNPLRRLCSFSCRFHERFDLYESQLLRVDTCERARQIEAALKTEFSTSQVVCPPWLPKAAGGHTEWFSAVYLSDAVSRLPSFSSGDAARTMSAKDFLHTDLMSRREQFESWAIKVAHQLNLITGVNENGSLLARSLHDWLDIHRALDVPLFSEEPEQATFVRKINNVYRHARR